MSDYSMLRPDIIESLRRYADNGIPTGGFLEAVLSNDLKEACARADVDNILVLQDIVRYCYWEIPGKLWGSPEAVKAHLEYKAKERARL